MDIYSKGAFSVISSNPTFKERHLRFTKKKFEIEMDSLGSILYYCNLCTLLHIFVNIYMICTL